jgi:hypothetical protein
VRVMSIVTGVQSAQVLGPTYGELFKFQSAKQGASGTRKESRVKDFAREFESGEIDSIL